MKHTFLLFLLASGCTTLAMKSDKPQLELTLSKTRAQVEEMKHDLYTQRMEISILDGRMSALSKETLDAYKAKLDACYAVLSKLEERLALLEQKPHDRNP